MATASSAPSMVGSLMARLDSVPAFLMLIRYSSGVCHCGLLLVNLVYPSEVTGVFLLLYSSPPLLLLSSLPTSSFSLLPLFWNCATLMEEHCVQTMNVVNI